MRKESIQAQIHHHQQCMSENNEAFKRLLIYMEEMVRKPEYLIYLNNCIGIAYAVARLARRIPETWEALWEETSIAVVEAASIHHNTGKTILDRAMCVILNTRISREHWTYLVHTLSRADPKQPRSGPLTLENRYPYPGLPSHWSVRRHMEAYGTPTFRTFFHGKGVYWSLISMVARWCDIQLGDAILVYC